MSRIIRITATDEDGAVLDYDTVEVETEVLIICDGKGNDLIHLCLGRGIPFPAN